MIICPEGQVSNELSENREKIESMRRLVLMIWIVQIIIGSCKIIISFWLCVSETIACVILYLSITQLNYCNCVIYIVLSAFNFLAAIAYLGNQLYHNVDLFQLHLFKTLLIYATMGFYSFSLPIVFQAYKQFKAMVYHMLLSQTNCQSSQSFITQESNISINGFQQTFKISDLEEQHQSQCQNQQQQAISPLNSLNSFNHNQFYHDDDHRIDIDIELTDAI